MTNPPRSPDPNSPQASRSEKILNAKGRSERMGATGQSEVPNSRLKKFGIWFVVAMIVLFIIMDFVDRANRNKKNSQLAPTADMPINRSV